MAVGQRQVRLILQQVQLRPGDDRRVMAGHGGWCGGVLPALPDAGGLADGSQVDGGRIHVVNLQGDGVKGGMEAGGVSRKGLAHARGRSPCKRQ